jgi:hypothetical protein
VTLAARFFGSILDDLLDLAGLQPAGLGDGPSSG